MSDIRLSERHYTNAAKWTPRTMADDYAERGEPAPAFVTCERCKRTHVPPWVMIDVSALDVAIRGRYPWACDGCKTDWFRRGVILKSEWIAALGGPASLVERVEAIEASRTVSLVR